MNDKKKKMLKIFFDKREHKVLLSIILIGLLSYFVIPLKHVSFLEKLKQFPVAILAYLLFTFGKFHKNTKRFIFFFIISFLLFNLILLLNNTYTLENFLGLSYLLSTFLSIYLRLLFKENYDKLLTEVDKND